MAVRRDQRDRAPADWLDRLTAVDGVRVTGSSPARAPFVRAQFEASAPAAVEQVRATLGEWCWVEPVVEHQRRA